jgi:hypothetical protein
VELNLEVHTHPRKSLDYDNFFADFFSIDCCFLDFGGFQPQNSSAGSNAWVCVNVIFFIVLIVFFKVL